MAAVLSDEEPKSSRQSSRVFMLTEKFITSQLQKYSSKNPASKDALPSAVLAFPGAPVGEGR
jgi:hypothetical protein